MFREKEGGIAARIKKILPSRGAQKDRKGDEQRGRWETSH